MANRQLKYVVAAPRGARGATALRAVRSATNATSATSGLSASADLQPSPGFELGTNRADRRRPVTPDILVCECPFFIHFAREVMAERKMLRLLAHRVVDMVVDIGKHRILRIEFPFSLSYLARKALIRDMSDLVQQARAQAGKRRRASKLGRID